MTTKDDQIAAMRQANRKAAVEAIQDGRIQRAGIVASKTRYRRSTAKRSWKRDAE